jgi:predicted GNAT superfamily acetyltransferase
MQIRALTTLEDCRRVVVLERDVWEFSDGEDVVPVALLVVSVKRGGMLLGAFDAAGELKGFAYAIAAMKDGRATLWSHMVGVTSDVRGSGIGTRLKLAQREHAMRRGIALIEWTFDPMQALNAYFNFAKLGVVAREYLENAYGESSSPLHRGTPTDRFIAEWHLAAPHVVRRVADPRRLSITDAAIDSAPVVNPATAAGAWLAPRAAALDLDAPRLLVEIPGGFSAMQARNPSLALEWRMTTRQVFQTYFGRGYEAVDFAVSPDRSRGHFVLAQQSLIADR